VDNEVANGMDDADPRTGPRLHMRRNGQSKGCGLYKRHYRRELVTIRRFLAFARQKQSKP